MVYSNDSEMTKAEERALEAYPVNMTPLNYQDLIEQFGGKTEIDVNTYPRCLFQQGYEQAEKDLTFMAKVSSGPDGFYYGKGYNQAKKDLGWISVEDRLPEEGHFVLTCVSDTGTPQCVGMALLLKDGTWWDGDVKVRVDYWMEVPKLNETRK